MGTRAEAPLDRWQLGMLLAPFIWLPICYGWMNYLLFSEGEHGRPPLLQWEPSFAIMALLAGVGAVAATLRWSSPGIAASVSLMAVALVPTLLEAAYEGFTIVTLLNVLSLYVVAVPVTTLILARRRPVDPAQRRYPSLFDTFEDEDE